MADLGAGTTDYPTSLDTNPTPEGVNDDSDRNPGEGAIAAILAIQAELGTDPAQNKSTLKAYTQAEHDADGEHTQYNPHVFFQDNVAASQSDVALLVAGSGTVSEVTMPFAGSVTGISIASNEARTADTLTVDATINGTASGLQATLDGDNTTYHYTTQAKDVDTFSAGDRLGVDITTGGSWAPVTADIIVVVYVSFNV